METLAPGRVKPSRVKRMRELLTIEKEARQIYAEFEDHKRTRRRLARRARKLAKHVRRRYPDMRLLDRGEIGLHDVVSDLASTLHLDNKENEFNYDDPAHKATNSFDRLFTFLRELADVPWLKGRAE